MATRKLRAQKTAYVPRVVFTIAVAAVVPALAPASCGTGPAGVACTSFCGVAAVAMGGFGGVAAVAMGGFGGSGGSGGSGGTSHTGGAGGTGGTAGGTTGGGGTASLGVGHEAPGRRSPSVDPVALTGFAVPADQRAVDALADARPAKNTRAARSRARRRG